MIYCSCDAYDFAYKVEVVGLSVSSLNLPGT